MPEVATLRDRFVSMVRLRAILQALASVRFGLAASRLDGDAATGSYVEDDNCGNHHVVFWNKDGIVMLSFDHDSPESEYGMARDERTPEARLPDVPRQLAKLAERACEHGERLATDGCWILGDRQVRGGFDERFPRYDEDPDLVLPEWLEEGPLEPAFGELALKLLNASASGPYTMTDEDTAVALAPAAGAEQRPDPESIAVAVAALARLGVEWPGAVEQVTAMQLASRREEAASGAAAATVLEAALSPRRPGRAATAADADIDGRPPEPPSVPVVLPDVSVPVVDLKEIEEKLPALLDTALEGLRRGGRSYAYPALEEAWVLTRSPRIANALDATLKWTFDLPFPGRTQKAADVERRLATYLAAPSWRASRAALSFLVAGAFYENKDDVQRAEDTAAAVLVAMRDVRFAEPLAEHCARNRPDPQPPPIRESLLVALRALQTFEPPDLGAANEAKLDGIDNLINGWRESPGKRTVRELMRAVYDAPRDLEIRKELAARLVESDDPRGELMQLQLARYGTDKKPKKREKELIAEHRLKWLREIVWVLAPSDEVFQNGFLWQAATGDSSDERKEAGQYPILITGAGTQLEWSTVERLTVWRHFRVGTCGMLGGKRLYNLRELTDIGRGELTSIAEGSERPLEVLELGFPRTDGVWAGTSYHAQLGAAFDRLPNLREARLGATRSSLETVSDLARRAKALRSLTIGVATQKLLPDAIDMALSVGLEAIGTLAAYHDLYYELGTRTLRIEYPHQLHDNIAIRGANRIRSLGSHAPLHVVVRVPAGAKIASRGDDPGRPPLLTRRSESMELAPIWEAAHAVGATVAIEPHVPHWSKSPVRTQ